MDLQCLLVTVCEHLAEDISHSAICWSSETFPFSTEGFCYSETLACVCVCMHGTERTRDLKRASNCSEMSQKGGLARGYKPVVGVKAFLAEDRSMGYIKQQKESEGMIDLHNCLGQFLLG